MLPWCLWSRQVIALAVLVMFLGQSAVWCAAFVSAKHVCYFFAADMSHCIPRHFKAADGKPNWCLVTFNLEGGSAKRSMLQCCRDNAYAVIVDSSISCKSCCICMHMASHVADYAIRRTATLYCKSKASSLSVMQMAFCSSASQGMDRTTSNTVDYSLAWHKASQRTISAFTKHHIQTVCCWFIQHAQDLQLLKTLTHYCWPVVVDYHWPVVIAHSRIIATLLYIDLQLKSLTSLDMRNPS